MLRNRGDLEQLMHAASGGGQNGDAAVIGRQVPMRSVVAAGGVTLADTQLISMRVQDPRQWVVTLQQPVKGGQQQPWAENFDGAAYEPPPGPPGPSIFGAPSLPAQASGVTSKLQCNLRWGAGGVSFLTRFDYPMAGATFGVTADSFDLDVFVQAPGGQQAIPAASVPVVGGFMVPGIAAEATPLRWLDVTAQVGVGLFADWSVKPYARRVRVIAPTTDKVGISFITLNGASIVFVLGTTNRFETEAGAGVDAVVDIPAGTEIVRLFNSSAAGPKAITPEWWIGLV